MRRSVVVPAVLLAVTLLVAPAAASPQPTPVCRFCGGQFGSAAQDAGVNVTVASSEVDVHVEADGSARWVVRLELSNGSAALAAAPDRLETAARSLAEEGYGLPEDPTFVAAAVDGDRVTLRYRAPGAGDRHAGVLVVDLLHDGGREPWYHVNAERFTIHGPEGTVVVNTPESGRVDAATVTWTGESGEEWYGGADLEGSPYVAFAPAEATAADLRGSLAVALATGPIVATAVRHFVLVQTLVFGLGLGVVVLGVRRFRPDPPIAPLAIAVGLLGGVGVLVPLVTHGLEWLSAPPILALGLAGLVRTTQGRARLRRPRGQLVAVVGLLAVSYGVLLGVHLGLADRWTRPALLALRATALGFPLAAMVPLGAVLARPDADPRRWFVLALLGFVAVPVTLVDLVDPPAGIGAGFYMLALGALALATPVVGALGLVLGRSLALGAPDAD